MFDRGRENRGGLPYTLDRGDGASTLGLSGETETTAWTSVVTSTSRSFSRSKGSERRLVEYAVERTGAGAEGGVCGSQQEDALDGVEGGLGNDEELEREGVEAALASEAAEGELGGAKNSPFSRTGDSRVTEVKDEDEPYVRWSSSCSGWPSCGWTRSSNASTSLLTWILVFNSDEVRRG